MAPVRAFTATTWKRLTVVVVCCLISLPLWMAVIKHGTSSPQPAPPKPPTRQTLSVRIQKACKQLVQAAPPAFWDASEAAHTRTRPTFAVVTPYVGAQVDNLLHTLRDVWPQFPACEGKAGEYRPVLIFLFHRELNDSRQADITAVLEASGQRHCFSEVRFMSSCLTDEQDPYPRGPSEQLCGFFNYSITDRLLQHTDYFFYMEPDSVPVVRNWLSCVQWHMLGPSFWIKGSIYRGQSYLPPELRLHINGNALYSLRDPIFLAWVLHNACPSFRATGEAFDSGFFSWLTTHENWPFAAMYAHKFIFSNFIQNHCYSEWTVSGVLEKDPDTCLVHGGTRVG